MLNDIIDIIIYSSFIILWFLIMYYIGSSNTRRIYYKKIKNTGQRIKDLFDNNKSLPDDIIFFSYGTKESSGSIIKHIFWAVLSFCLLYPLLGIVAGKLFPDAVVLQYIIPFIAGGLVIYWRYSLYKKFITGIKEGKYRYGVFVLRDELIVREEGWPICHIIPRDSIVHVEDCSIWTSDSSEDNGIKITVSPGEGTDQGEIIILGEFIGAFRDEVIDSINKWRYRI